MVIHKLAVDSCPNKQVTGMFTALVASHMTHDDPRRHRPTLATCCVQCGPEAADFCSQACFAHFKQAVQQNPGVAYETLLCTMVDHVDLAYALACHDAPVRLARGVDVVTSCCCSKQPNLTRQLFACMAMPFANVVCCTLPLQGAAGSGTSLCAVVVDLAAQELT